MLIREAFYKTGPFPPQLAQGMSPGRNECKLYFYCPFQTLWCATQLPLESLYVAWALIQLPQPSPKQTKALAITITAVSAV